MRPRPVDESAHTGARFRVTLKGAGCLRGVPGGSFTRAGARVPLEEDLGGDGGCAAGGDELDRVVEIRFAPGHALGQRERITGLDQDMDPEGRFRLVNGQPTVNFGRNRGRRLKDMSREEPGFLRWILKGDFSEPVKTLAKKYLPDSP